MNRPASKSTSKRSDLALVRVRARAERLKSLIKRLIGPVQGIAPSKD